MTHRCRLFSLLLLSASLPSCTVVKAGSGGTARTLIGIVRVELPPTTGRVSAIDVRTVGLGWDDGPFAGYRGSNWISAPPDRCQLTVIIRSTVQGDHAARLLRQLQGNDLCVADFSRPPAPAPLSSP